MADKVYIRDLKLRGKHGVYDWEWEKEQEFIVNIVADVDVREAGKSDNLEHTADWQSMHRIARDTVAGPTVYLIEKMATIIAEKILEHPRVQSVTVSICKNEILSDGVPGVSITRTR